MRKTHYSYNELITACQDTDNKGKNNPITLVSVKNDTCEFYFSSTPDDVRTGNIALIVNGAVDEVGIITNPEMLKDWDGFSPVDSY